MWTFFLGPLLAVLPRRWRNSLPFSGRISWKPATVISGIAEMTGGLIWLSNWYSHAMSAWVSNGIDSALSGKMGPGVTVQGIGFAALFVWWMHPLTWLIGYVSLEGAARSCAALGDTNLGTLPLFLLDAVLAGAFHRRAPAALDSARPPGGLSSVASSLRERMLTARSPVVSDELCFTKNGTEEILEIRASRRKPDWTPPRVVRYEDAFYRLESDRLGAAPRPFHYILRRLSAGVLGRKVLVYSPGDVVTRKQ